MENISPQLVLAVTAVIELGRRVSVRDWFAVYTIVAAAGVGTLAGYFNIFGVPSVEVGLLGGLVASGAVALVSKVSGSSREAVG